MVSSVFLYLFNHQTQKEYIAFIVLLLFTDDQVFMECRPCQEWQ